MVGEKPQRVLPIEKLKWGKMPYHKIKLMSADVSEELLVKMISFHVVDLPYRVRCKLP